MFHFNSTESFTSWTYSNWLNLE